VADTRKALQTVVQADQAVVAGIVHQLPFLKGEWAKFE
jgi:hypothetical protein